MACFELTKDDFKAMHHALGYPDDVRVESYRNYYCASIGTLAEERLSIVASATGFWEESHRINDGRSIIFFVTDSGRAALADWLEGNKK